MNGIRWSKAGICAILIVIGGVGCGGGSPAATGSGRGGSTAGTTGGAGTGGAGTSGGVGAGGPTTGSGGSSGGTGGSSGSGDGRGGSATAGAAGGAGIGGGGGIGGAGAAGSSGGAGTAGGTAGTGVAGTGGAPGTAGRGGSAGGSSGAGGMGGGSGTGGVAGTGGASGASGAGGIAGGSGTGGVPGTSGASGAGAAAGTGGSSGGSPHVEWVRQFGTTADELVYSLRVDATGNVIVGGTTSGTLPGQTSAGGADAFVRKYDAAGNELWTRQFGSVEDEPGYSSVHVDASNDIVIAGETRGVLPGQPSSDSYDAFVRKYDAAGNEVWTRQFGTPSSESVSDVTVDASRNVIVVGTTNGAFSGQPRTGGIDVFIRKYDPAGNEIWTRQFGSTVNDQAWGASTDARGSIVVVGHIPNGALPGHTAAGNDDAFVRKYDSAGNELWTRQFGTANNDRASSVGVDTLGNTIVAGYTDGVLPGQASAGSIDAFVRKYDEAGNELWTRQFGSPSIDQGLAVAVNTLGHVVVAGWARGNLSSLPNAGLYDAFVRTYDGAGNELWTLLLGTTFPEYAYAVGVHTDRSVVFAGGADRGALPGQSALGGYDAFVVKLAP